MAVPGGPIKMKRACPDGAHVWLPTASRWLAECSRCGCLKHLGYSR